MFIEVRSYRRYAYGWQLVNITRRKLGRNTAKGQTQLQSFLARYNKLEV